MAEPSARRVPRTSCVMYLRKAEDFARLMDSARAARNSNGTGLAAVHCTISASDALTTYLLGERSAGRDHRDVLRLLAHAEIADRANLVNQVRRVLDKKNQVEYEGRPLTQEEAEDLFKAALRVLRTVKATVPPPR